METRAGKRKAANDGVIKAPLFSKTGQEKKLVTLENEIFGAPVNVRLLKLVQKGYSANLRRGTASTKTKGEVSGGGKKPWKQKGTGRARAGSSRSPIWKGGGTVFGPRPRKYTVALPGQMKKQALISALSLRARKNNVLLLEDTKIPAPKTKEFAKILKALPLENKKILCVVKEMSSVLKRATQNLDGILHIEPARDVNAYDVLRRSKLLIEEEALSILKSRLMEEPS